MVQKLGQSTLFVKVDFKDLTSVVAFTDFVRSVMAFTPKLTFPAAWLMSVAAIKVIKYAKKCPKSSQQLRKFFSDVFDRKSTFRYLCRVRFTDWELSKKHKFLTLELWWYPFSKHFCQTWQLWCSQMDSGKCFSQPKKCVDSQRFFFDYWLITVPIAQWFKMSDHLW